MKEILEVISGVHSIENLVEMENIIDNFSKNDTDIKSRQVKGVFNTLVQEPLERHTPKYKKY